MRDFGRYNIKVMCAQEHTQIIDNDGYRLNVGIILCNNEHQLLWARRIGQRGWQFPQGGIKRDETPEQALYRELQEEIGLPASQVAIVGCTKQWLRYRLPKKLVRHDITPLCIGQKQLWYLLRLIGSDGYVQLGLTEAPEFDCWKWVPYWYPLQEVVAFKRDVYERALNELAPLLHLRKRVRTAK